MPKKPTYEELEKRIRELEKAELDRKCTEEELRKLESKYNLMFEASTNGIMAFNIDQAVTDLCQRGIAGKGDRLNQRYPKRKFPLRAARLKIQLQFFNSGRSLAG